MISLPRFEFIVESYLKGVRIDSFLIKHLRNYSPWRMQRMIHAGAVFIDNREALLVDRVNPGQRVNIKLIEPPDKLIAPEEVELSIVHEDPWLLAINKPAPMTVHPVGTIQSETLCNAVQHHLDQQTTYKGLLRPGIVHRLDRMTSGLILLSKEHLSHRELSLQFQRSKVDKTYLAILEGVMKRDEGVIDFPIGTHPECETILMSAGDHARDAKAALTQFRVIDRGPRHTLVRAKPVTGRLHQIRVHFAACGHPVGGDEFYGVDDELKGARLAISSHTNDEGAGENGPISKEFSRFMQPGRHALHCVEMQFRHPITRCPMTLNAKCPIDFQMTWNQLRCDDPR
ncbi:Ribosomal large subunit pseudouridine synthase D [Polystyrenella longa]|uniref:Pseudouridine synthase n=1 Tax=Polystyrenella longa TaxID=2528007 RepID=A0A518CM80_9PLAN|nr:RluA family pseudouridine synthase [Polystyrenella longa]QDU80336.1 Ribosomal large subunit pseudouridine synthase D [Polystyrenella longa]